MIPRAHFKYLERMNYEDIVKRKKELDEEAHTFVRKKKADKRYKSNNTRAESITLMQSISSNPTFNFPSLKSQAYMQLAPNNLQSRTKRNLTHVMSNLETSRYISTNPSVEQLSNINHSFDSRFRSPPVRTLAGTTLLHESK